MQEDSYGTNVGCNRVVRLSAERDTCSRRLELSQMNANTAKHWLAKSFDMSPGAAFPNVGHSLLGYSEALRERRTCFRGGSYFPDNLRRDFIAHPAPVADPWGLCSLLWTKVPPRMA
jgi:hypothetical protein